MNQRAYFLLQVLEKIGVPLLDAAAARNDGGGVKEAERVAELLGKAVQMSVALSGAVESRDKSGNSDAVRVALASLSSSIIAGYYSQTGKVPGDADMKRLTAALEAVLIFADNFTAAADETARLERLSPDMAVADEGQIGLQYISVFIPLVDAVSRFSFGQPEKKLAQDIASRLAAQAEAMRKNMLPDLDGGREKRADLIILDGLVRLYVRCHEAEMRRLAGLDEDKRTASLSMDPVWKAFDKEAGMLESLAGSMVPSGGFSSGNGGGVLKSPLPPAPDKKEAAAPPSPPPVSGGAEGSAEGGGNYNPMSFFKKKEDGDGK
ncbi:MAG: hypothetical protein HY370_10010 [Proteobacteria bacterium]|nr:hypothetical protein [Pseudomonadota bacterium]